MARESQELSKPNPDYTVLFPPDTLFSFTALVFGPADTLYAHKLIKLHFEIPEEYPMAPPSVNHIQYSPDRLHPNLYAEGKVCLSILGTWAGEPWAFGMTCHSVLITIRSLLDNAPYVHEPGARDHPGFNRWVRYAGWRALLLDHFHHGPLEVRARVGEFLRENGKVMREELVRQALVEGSGKVAFQSPYRLRGPHGLSKAVWPEYEQLIADLDRALEEARAAAPGEAEAKGDKRKDSSMEEASPAKRTRAESSLASLGKGKGLSPSTIMAGASSSTVVGPEISTPTKGARKVAFPGQVHERTSSPVKVHNQASPPTRAYGHASSSPKVKTFTTPPSAVKGTVSTPVKSRGPTSPLPMAKDKVRHAPQHPMGRQNIQPYTSYENAVPVPLKQRTSPENTPPKPANTPTGASQKCSPVEVIDLT